MLDEYDVRTDAGVFVSDLVPGSAAADGGLELGDVVIAVDGEAMDTPGDLQSTVQAGEPGIASSSTSSGAGSVARWW